MTPGSSVTRRWPTPGWRLVLATLNRLPQGLLSRAFGWLADRPVPRILRPAVLGSFVRFTGIRMEEAEQPIVAYRSLNHLFVRRLRPGIHHWPGDPRVLVSPVDGVVGQTGRIRDGTLIQAKGLGYGAADLLGSAEDALPFRDGSFLTLYLSPRHYHRIHTPMPGTLRRARYIPGTLLPVNDPAVSSIDRLFCRNERLLVMMESAMGLVVVVAVGAYNVGRISAAFDPAWSGESRSWVTNRRDPPPRERRYPDGIAVAEGQELMAFHLGSTVILLTEPGQSLEPALEPGCEVRAGAVLARPGG